MKKNRNKFLKWVPILAICTGVFPITLSSNKMNYSYENTTLQQRTINQNNNNNNEYPQLIEKPYYILNQALSEKSVTIMIVGDGFRKQDQTLFYQKTKEFVTKFFQYQQYAQLRRYINVYTVFVESNEVGPKYKNGNPNDTYFETSLYGAKINLTSNGTSRLNMLVSQVQNLVGENSFLIPHVLVNSNEYAGLANWFSRSTLGGGYKTFVHEISHMFGLSDEYTYSEDEHVSKNGDYNTVKWKEFIGYNGTTIAEQRDGSITYYTPARHCIMNETYAFDEVCKFLTWKNIAEKISLEQLYVGVPAINPTFDTDTEWNDRTKNIGIDWRPDYDKIQNKKIDVRSVIYNPFNASKTVTLKSTITNNADSSQNQTFEQSFTIPAGELKQIKITSLKELKFNSIYDINIDNKIYDENDNLLSDGKWYDYEYTKEFANKQLTINFLDENNQKLQFLASQQFYYNNDNEINNLSQIDLPGYEKISVSKNTDNSQNWYYKQLDTKTITMNIKDSFDDKLLEIKKIKLIKDKKIILDDKWFGNNTGRFYYVLGNKEFNYNDYLTHDEINVDIYQMYTSNQFFISSTNNITIKQGEAFDLNDYVYIKTQHNNNWEKNKIMSKYLIQITSNNLDVNTPGNYQIHWKYNSSSGVLNITVLTKDGEITPPDQKPEEPLIPILPPTTVPPTPLEPPIVVPPTEIIPPSNKPDDLIPLEPSKPITPPDETNPPLGNNSSNDKTTQNISGLEPWTIAVISVIALTTIVGIIFLVKWLLGK